MLPESPTVPVWVLDVPALPGRERAQQQPAPQGQMAGMDMRADHTGSELGPLRIALGDETAEWTPEMLAALPH